MRGRLLQLLVAATLILGVGRPWDVLQSFAWVSMVVSYSRAYSLADAVAMTFDGKHPCKMCKSIEKGRGEEKSQPPPELKNGSKVDVGPVWETAAFIFRCDREPVLSLVQALHARPGEPPQPRPKLA